MDMLDDQNLICEKDLDQLLADLRTLEPELRAKGVVELNLFGSRSRHDYKPDSDVDLLVMLEPRPNFSLFALAGLQRFIQERIGAKVHVTMASGLRPETLRTISSQSIIVY
jgi:uncharacterized protein